jgi:hypothetical protein
MTPKEKAIELIDKFNQFTIKQLMYHKNGKTKEYYGDAKQCALIAVDEILNNIIDDDKQILNYWQQVKQEIEKL